MRKIANSQYAAFFFTALVFQILCAWFSVGFYQVDEHFQVLEFANYKLGFTTIDLMPWEFRSQMRAALLPTIVFMLGKIMLWCKVYNPYTLVFILRLIVGVAAWFVYSLLSILLLDEMKTEKGKKLFILIILFTWFVPALNVRFSNENFSGICLLYGLYFLLGALNRNKPMHKNFLIAGLFLGISCFIRIQNIAAVCGVFAWFIYKKKLAPLSLLMFLISFIGLCGVNVLIDWWFYGMPVFTPYNYFYNNIVLQKAAEFGVSPWWDYFRNFIIEGGPPLSILFLLGFVVGIFAKNRNPLVWAIILAIALHLAISHKELRFLFPFTYIFLFITALGFDYLLTKQWYLKIERYVFIFMLIVAIPFYFRGVFFPASVTIKYPEYVYYHASAGSNTFIVKDVGTQYTPISKYSTFYLPHELKQCFIDSTGKIAGCMDACHIDTALYLDMDSRETIRLDGFAVKKAYCFYPEWIKYFDFNHWMERTKFWTIYQVTRVK